MRTRIHTPSLYRRAISERQRLDGAREGSREHRRRHELLAAMSEFEQRFSHPRYAPGKPAPFALTDALQVKRRWRLR